MIRFDVGFTYEGQEIPALKQIAGHITPGTCHVLCGGSGCGKTTLIRCLNHLIPSSYEGEMTGFVVLNGEDIADKSVGEIGQLAASVFQEPRSHFFTMNSSHEVSFGMENAGVSHDEMIRRTDEVFEHFGLEYLKNRNVFQLSSGERQIVALLAACAADTDILLLDEPTANLDYASIERIAAMLTELKAQGKTIVISEHRLQYLRRLADAFWVMSHGELVRVFPGKELAGLSEPELSALSLRCLDFEQIELRRPAPIKLEVHHSLEVQNLAFTYKRAQSPVLKDISFESETGHALCIIGSNGCGKTTLGKSIAGLNKGFSGKIILDGKPLSRKELIHNALFVLQETEYQFFTESVLHELTYQRDMTPEFEAEIERMLKKLDMWEFRDSHPFALSGGQMQRLALLNAYFSEKPIVILDEPTAGLDKRSLEACVDLIRNMKRTKIVLIISHDIELISQVASRVLCLSQGVVEREVAIRDKQDVRDIIRYMHEHFAAFEEGHVVEKPTRRCLFDPRPKMLLFIIGMFASVSGNTAFVMILLGIVMTVALLERFYGSFLLAAGSLAVLYGSLTLFPDNILAFFGNFLPRMIIPFLALEVLIGRDEVSRTLAALRKLHVPELAIMVLSIIFRFFPVIMNDTTLMRQSMKTRGCFMTLEEKLSHVLSYVEVLLVPLALRVIKIAETLSASAETRGIALPGKKSSFVSLKLGIQDALLVLILIGFLVCSLCF